MDQEEQISQLNLKAIGLYLSYWKKFRLLSTISVIFSLIQALQSTVIPLLIALTLNQLVNHHSVNVSLMVIAGFIQIAILIGGYSTDCFGIAILHDNVVRNLYQDCFTYLSNQDYDFFANRFSGSLVTQASRFAKSYTYFNDTVFFNVLPQLFSSIIIVVVMIHYNLLLGLIVLLLWLATTWLVVKFALQRMPLRRAAVIKESEQVGELADVITNAITVKTFAAEEKEYERHEGINKIRAGLFLRSWRRAVRNAWIVEGVCAVMQMIVFVGGILAVKHNSIGIATFLLFQVYILKIIDNISKSVFTVRQLEAVSGDAEEMAELFEVAPLVKDKQKPEKSEISSGEIQFQNVNFYYDDANFKSALFESFDLRIKPGEKVGLVGPSGGGKTTITRLMLRFVDIKGGSIKIDNQDIRDIKQRDLRQNIAYVPQEPLLFHRSIKENISYGMPSANETEIEAVAKQSFAYDFIKDLPNGYDTLVGERGIKLSGGQRQRIAIARAMLTKAPILILDEATSALDSESERYIQKALWKLMKDKTAVVIAHRLSTIQRLDRIVVLDKGRIIEEGTHQALLEQNGLYAKLWSHQSGSFLEDN
jgi:ATP-binding cassette subfamily B protein